MTHHFDTKIAEQYGINAAVILQNILFWSKKNSANKSNIFDGSVWIYNSIQAWKELFPYMGISQIKTALKKLEAANIIKSANYNEHQYDRTKWYAICDQSICQDEPLHLSKSTNANDENRQPIPVNKPFKEKEEEKYLKYIKVFLDEILNDSISFEVFAIEFYEYIYPRKKTSMQQKIWYGNKVKKSILEKDIKTYANIKTFLEDKEQKEFVEQRRRG